MLKTVSTSAFELSTRGWSDAKVRGAQTLLKSVGLSLWDFSNWEALHRPSNMCELPTDDEMCKLTGGVKEHWGYESLAVKTQDTRPLSMTPANPRPVSKAARRLEDKTNLHAVLGVPEDTDLTPYINKLSLREARLITLRYIYKLTNSKIAERQGKATATISHSMQNAVAHLRGILEVYKPCMQPSK